jgi:hypothetical protein
MILVENNSILQINVVYSSEMSIENSAGKFQFPPVDTVSTDNPCIDQLIHIITREGYPEVMILLNVHIT